MKNYKKKLTKVVDNIYCDGCGESCTTTEPVVEHEYGELSATWGYFSNQDGTQYDIQLCEKCFNEIVDILKSKRKKTLGPFNYPHKYDPLEGRSYFPS
jgi:hypothetical protein